MGCLNSGWKKKKRRLQKFACAFLERVAQSLMKRWLVREKKLLFEKSERG